MLEYDIPEDSWFHINSNLIMTPSSPSQKNNPLNPISKFLPKSQRHFLETRKKISIEIRAKIHPKIFEQGYIYIYILEAPI